jgi:hypothetical protein
MRRRARQVPVHGGDGVFCWMVLILKSTQRRPRALRPTTLLAVVATCYLWGETVMTAAPRKVVVMDLVMSILVGSIVCAVLIVRAGRRAGDGQGLTRWAWALLPLSVVMFVFEFVVLDVVTEDGARSFGGVGDLVVQVAALTLAAALPVLAYVFSCLAARRSRRWKDLIPAALLVGVLAWLAVGLIAAGSGYWWIPGLAAGLGGAGILLSWTVRSPAHTNVAPHQVSH